MRKRVGKILFGSESKGSLQENSKIFIEAAFSHEQYSGYHSQYKTTDLEIFDLVHEMGKEFPWLGRCLNHFEVTNVGANHDLMHLFDESITEPELM